MFEQELYNYEAARMESKEGDLFYKYEIKSWELSPRIYKILAASAIFTLLFVGVVGQTQLLTMKGCDSPFVGRVCQVLDTVYVGAMLFGTDREYIDAAYEKTELADAEITYIDLSNITPQLQYPEGYFQIANPVQYAMLQQQAKNPAGFDTSGFSNINPTPNAADNLINTPPVTPNPIANPVQGNLPSGFDPQPSRRKRGGKITDINDETVAEKSDASDSTDSANTQKNPENKETKTGEEEAQADSNGVFINKRPTKVQEAYTLKLVDADEIKLDEPFKVIIAGTLGLAKDGKTVILKNPKPLPVDKNVPNNPAMVKFVQEWILAVGDAGWFGYLDLFDANKKLKSKRIEITVEQDAVYFIANVRYELPTENAAKTTASGLNSLLGLAAARKTGDEKIFLDSAKKKVPTSEGNMLILNFEIPTPIVQEMIQRKLAESKEPKQEPTSTGNIGAPGDSDAK